MALPTSNLTKFPNGVGQFTMGVVGAAAGDITLTGVTTRDKILFVQAVAWGTDGVCSAVADLTSEFSITAADTINNTGGTSTADQLVLVTVAKGAA